MARRSNWRGLSRTTQVIPGVPNNEIPDVMVSAKSVEVLKEFMPIFIERLRKNMRDLNVGHSGDTDDSFAYSVRKGSDKVSANLRFLFYARFVDMGVGKGTTLAERQSGRPLMAGRAGVGNRRKPKPWFGPQYIFEVQRLQEIMTETLAQLATTSIGVNDVTLEIPI